MLSLIQFICEESESRGADWIASHHSADLFSAAFLVVAAAAAAVEEAFVVFLPLVDLPRFPRLRPPGVVEPLVLAFLLLPVCFAAGFLPAGFWMAALVHAATAFVKAAVLSNHLSCADGFAVGPTCVLKRSTSENRPAVLTSDWRILNFDSGAWKGK